MATHITNDGTFEIDLTPRNHEKLSQTDLESQENVSLLPQEERHNILHNSKSSKGLTRAWFIISRLCIATLVIWAIIDLGLRAYTSFTAPPKTCYCGKTPEDAIAMGCTYDHLAGAWLPQHCYDEGLVKIFEDPKEVGIHNWTYTIWPDIHNEISIQDVSLRGCIPSETENPDVCAVGITTDWHMTHCLYLWWKLARSQSNGKVASERYRDEHHVRHCVRAMMEKMEDLPEYNVITGRTRVWMFKDHLDGGLTLDGN